MPGMTRLLLVRHGETDWNREGRWQGHSGPGLNAAGREQAAALGRRLARLGPDLLVASDLPRTLETAEVVAAATGLAIHADPGLREVDVGSWAGLTPAEIQARDADSYQRWLDGGTGWADGETYDEMHARVLGAVTALLDRGLGERIVLVAHGGTVRAVASWAAGHAHHERRHIPTVRNCSLTIVDRWRDIMRLISFNDDGHLPPAA